MKMDLPYLIGALILLWLPRQWLHLGWKPGHHDSKHPFDGDTPRAEDPDDHSVKFFPECRKLRNWIDLLRAAAGGWAVAVWAFPAAGPHIPRKVFVAQCAILLIGVLVQTLRFPRGRLVLFPPVFYLAGVFAGVAGWEAGLFAFVLMGAISSMLPSPAIFFVVNVAVAAVFGLMFHGKGRLMEAACLLYLVPALISMLTRLPLMQTSRRIAPEEGKAR